MNFSCVYLMGVKWKIARKNVILGSFYEES